MGLQFGIKECLDLNILDFKTKKPLVFIDYAETTSNENAGTRLDLTGGRGNAKQMSFDHSRTATFKLTIPMVDLNLLSILTGDDIQSGIGEIFKREVLPVTAGKVTLAETPIDGTVLVNELVGLRDIGADYTKTDAAPTGQQFTVSGKDVTFATTENGKEVIVFYQYAAPANAKTISIKSNKFPKAVEIYGEGLGRNQEDEQDYPVHVHVFKARPQTNFTLTMEGTNATKLELTFDCYEVKNAAGDGQYIDYIFETDTP